MAKHFKIVGVMRFSVLTPNYYSERFDGLDAIAAHLFSPERMALRFHLFENLVLPSLLAQSDQGFELVILTAQSLPAPYMQRLEQAISAAPNIRLSSVGADKHYQLIKQAYHSVDVGEASHRLMFRLDDDDAVALNYIKRLRKLATGLMQLQAKPQPQAIAFNRGFYVDMTGERNAVFDACERAPARRGR